MVYLTLVNIWDITVHALTFPWIVFQETFIKKDSVDCSSKEQVSIKTE